MLNKNIFIAFFFIAYLIPNFSFGQLVLTVAGIIDSAGAVNGSVTQATFNNPHDLAVDKLGNIYVADRFGHIIRKITPNGFVTTLAGSGVQGDNNGVGTNASFNEPWGICTDDIGNIYVADTRNNKIRKIDVTGLVTDYAGSGNFGTSDGQSTNATFGNPVGIVCAADGSLYVADHLTHIIRRISANGFVTTIAGKAFLTGTQDGIGSQARFNRPYGISLAKNGDILVADEWNHLIRRVTKTGVVTTIAGDGSVGTQDGQALFASFNFPWDVVQDSTGAIYVGDGYNDVIRKIDLFNNVTTYVGTAGISGSNDAVGSLASFNATTGLAYLGTTDEIYVADAYNNLIRKIINLNQQTVAIQSLQGGVSFCFGDTFEIKAAPNIYNTYDFYLDNVFVQSSNSFIYKNANIPIGIHSISVVAYKNNDAITSPPFVFEVKPIPIPNINIIGTTTFYKGDSVLLVANASSSYKWSTGETTATITVKKSGSYWVEISNLEGCIARSNEITIKVIEFSAPPIISFLIGDETLCYGERAVLTSNYDNNNQWLVNGFPILGATSPNLVITEMGTYQVQVTDSLGFNLISTAINISVGQKLLRNFYASDTVALPNTLINFVSFNNKPNLSHLWDFGDINAGIDNISTKSKPNFSYIDSGTYTIKLIVSDILGCADTLIKPNYIHIDLKKLSNGNNNGLSGGDEEVFIPTAFTPNSDGQNDIFRVRGQEIKSLKLHIYNQWGELVFETFDATDGWNGTFRGQSALSATYIYVVQVTMNDGRLKNFAGHFTLIR